MASGGDPDWDYQSHATAIKDKNITLFPTRQYKEWCDRANKLSQPPHHQSTYQTSRTIQRNEFRSADFLINIQTRKQIIKDGNTHYSKHQQGNQRSCRQTKRRRILATNDKGNLVINIGRFIRWLDSNAFVWIHAKGTDELQLVRIQNMIAEPSSIDQIRMLRMTMF